MAKARFEFLGKQEIDRIHNASMRVLEQVGILVHSESTTDMLIKGGALRSKDGKRVLLPEPLVKESLKNAPRRVFLASRDKKNDITIPDNDRVYVTNGGEGVYVTDLVTGESHSATSEDLRNFALIVQDVPQADFFWPMVGALEQPNRLKGIVELKVCLESTTKHIQAMAWTGEEVQLMVDMGSVVMGSPEELAKRPIFSAVECPISPLTFEKGLVEAQVEFARAGIPVVAMSAAVAGLTSPITQAGTFAQITAENLASLVISQVAKKGAPFIFSSDSNPGDLKAGSIDYGAIESTLMRTGMGQMGRYYGLPTMVSGIGLENYSASLANIWEGVPMLVMQGIVPSDLASGFGGIDQATGASLEQVLVDAWVWDIAREILRDFDTDDAAISFETIREAGIDGNFLSKRHTFLRMKKEIASATKPGAALANRYSGTEKGSVLKKAREEVKKILKRPREPLVTSSESARMQAIVDRLK